MSKSKTYSSIFINRSATTKSATPQPVSSNYRIDDQIADTMKYLYNMGLVIQSQVKEVVEDYKRLLSKLKK